MKRSWYASPYAVWMVLFTVVPVLLVLYYAFTGPDGQPTLENFGDFLQPVYLNVLWNSIWMAAVCTVICLFLGYPAAMFLASKDFSKYQSLLVLFILPMWMNFLLRTYAWMSLLEDTGLINQFLSWLGLPKMQMLYTEGAVMLGMVYNFIPFMILPVYSVMKKMDTRIVEAAEDLGADPVRVFTRVTLPLSLPGIISGITMVFMPAATTFAIPKLMGGGKYMLFGDLIEQQFLVSYNWNFGSSLSLIMMVLIMISIGLMKHWDPDGQGGGLF